MTALVQQSGPAAQALETLPKLIDTVAEDLARARTSAQVLEARDRAAVAYDAAARFTRRKAAFDEVTAMAMRLQARALRIEARAKERLADEYDAAQERGEVAGHGRSKVEPANVTTAADLGLRRDEIHEARRLRDAERADPGAIDAAIDTRLAAGQAPTRGALKRDVAVDREALRLLVGTPLDTPDFVAALRAVPAGEQVAHVRAALAEAARTPQPATRHSAVPEPDLSEIDPVRDREAARMWVRHCALDPRAVAEIIDNEGNDSPTLPTLVVVLNLLPREERAPLWCGLRALERLEKEFPHDAVRGAVEVPSDG